MASVACPLAKGVFDDPLRRFAASPLRRFARAAALISLTAAATSAQTILDAAAGGQTNVLRNSIVHTNTDVLNPGSITAGAPGASPIVEFSNVSWTGLAPYPGAGNIDQLPQFVNPIAFDFRLSATSPCVDAGNGTFHLPDHPDLNKNTNRTEPSPYDFGIPTARVLGLGIDMGAHER